MSNNLLRPKFIIFSAEFVSECFVSSMAANILPSSGSPGYMELSVRKKTRDVQIHESYQFMMKAISLKKDKSK